MALSIWVVLPGVSTIPLRQPLITHYYILQNILILKRETTLCVWSFFEKQKNSMLLRPVTIVRQKLMESSFSYFKVWTGYWRNHFPKLLFNPCHTCFYIEAGFTDGREMVSSSFRLFIQVQKCVRLNNNLCRDQRPTKSKRSWFVISMKFHYKRIRVTL